MSPLYYIKQINPWPMRNRYLIMLSAVICISLSNPVLGQDAYVKRFQPLADSLGQVYSIPANFILSVAVIESGRGKSRNVRLLKNHFGIAGKNNLYRTKKIRTRYKQYKTDAASYADFCKLVSRRAFYQKLKGNEDVRLWIEAMSKTRYSEKPLLWKKNILLALRQLE